MSSDKPKFYFEPVNVLVGRHVEAELESESDEERYAEESRTELSGQYFFKKVIAENREEFETIDISSEISSLVADAYQSVALKLKEKLSSVISPEMMDVLLRFPSKLGARAEYDTRRTFRQAPRLLYLHKESPSLVIPFSANVFCVLSNEAKHVQSLVASIKSKFEELNNVTKDFGLELLKFLTSKEYQSFFLEKIENVTKIEYGEPKNPFEKEVISRCSQITSSFLSNVNVQFKEPNESFEYDVFLSFPPTASVVIEPTDYSTLRKEMASQRLIPETLKSKIVLAMQDKAQRLEAKSIVVVNGFPQNTFLQLKTIADSRGVILMNQKDYKDRLPYELCRTMLLALSRRRRGRIIFG